MRLYVGPGTGFGLTILSTILFPIDSPITSAVFLTIFFDAVLAASKPDLVAVSINFFWYFTNRFLANYKNLYPLTNFVLLAL